MAKKKAEAAAAGEAPAKKKPGPKKGSTRKKKEVGHHEPGHLEVRSLTVTGGGGHSIHMAADETKAGVWVCGPNAGECLSMASVGDQSPFVAVYGGKTGYAATVPAVAIYVNRETGKTVIQTSDETGATKFAYLDDVLEHAANHGLLADTAPDGVNPVAFAPPPHVETAPTPEQTEALAKAREAAKPAEQPDDGSPEAKAAEAADVGREAQESANGEAGNPADGVL